MAVIGAVVAVGAAVASGEGEAGGLVGVAAVVGAMTGAVSVGVDRAGDVSTTGMVGVGAALDIPREINGRTANIPRNINPIMSAEAARIQFT